MRDATMGRSCFWRPSFGEGMMTVLRVKLVAYEGPAKQRISRGTTVCVQAPPLTLQRYHATRATSSRILCYARGTPVRGASLGEI